MPGRKPATASSALVPVATCARPCSAASGPSTSSSSALQWKHRSPALARYPSRSISRVRGRQPAARPRPVAKSRASSRSPPASDAETAVAAATRLGAEHPHRRRQHQGRVGAAGEGHQHRAQLAQPHLERSHALRRARAAGPQDGALGGGHLGGAHPRGYVRAGPGAARRVGEGLPNPYRVRTVTGHQAVGPTGRMRTMALPCGDPPAAQEVGTSTVRR